MLFGIDRGFAEVQIMKKCETADISWTFWYILIKFYIYITVYVI